jgi:hypothetical protein
VIAILDRSNEEQSLQLWVLWAAWRLSSTSIPSTYFAVDGRVSPSLANGPDKKCPGFIEMPAPETEEGDILDWFGVISLCNR